MDHPEPWYEVANINEIDTPALLVYPERIKKNIRTMIEMAGGADRLRPHVKTYKTTEVVRMQMEAGIHKFKCATIAEAEMLAIARAQDVLLAYQPVGPRIARLFELTRFYPKTKFSALVDHPSVVDEISTFFTRGRNQLSVFIDIDSGYHRTGIDPKSAFKLFEYAWNAQGINPRGLHVYDGHIHDSDPETRKKKCDAEFHPVEELITRIHNKFGIDVEVIAGGTPTFPIHARRENVWCSPGTTLLWDWNYQQAFPDLPFEFASVAAARIISKPASDLLCLDLGHKAIASENPLHNRIAFLNLQHAGFIGHSEEHLVVKVEDNNKFDVGDVIYGIPFHICPTVALHDRLYAIEKSKFVRTWNVIARDRIINH